MAPHLSFFFVSLLFVAFHTTPAHLMAEKAQRVVQRSGVLAQHHTLVTQLSSLATIGEDCVDLLRQTARCLEDIRLLPDEQDRLACFEKLTPLICQTRLLDQGGEAVTGRSLQCLALLAWFYPLAATAVRDTLARSMLLASLEQNLNLSHVRILFWCINFLHRKPPTNPLVLWELFTQRYRRLTCTLLQHPEEMVRLSTLAALRTLRRHDRQGAAAVWDFIEEIGLLLDLHYDPSPQVRLEMATFAC